jgi:hypothetical protein
MNFSIVCSLNTELFHNVGSTSHPSLAQKLRPALIRAPQRCIEHHRLSDDVESCLPL